jgi:hypothetical protein
VFQSLGSNLQHLVSFLLKPTHHITTLLSLNKAKLLFQVQANGDIGFTNLLFTFSNHCFVTVFVFEERRLYGDWLRAELPSGHSMGVA